MSTVIQLAHRVGRGLRTVLAPKRRETKKRHRYAPRLEGLEERELLAIDFYRNGLTFMPPYLRTALWQPALRSGVQMASVGGAAGNHQQGSQAPAWRVDLHGIPRGSSTGAKIGGAVGCAIGVFFAGWQGCKTGSFFGTIVGGFIGKLFDDGPKDIGPTSLEGLRQQKGSNGGGARGEGYRYQSAYDDFVGTWQGYEPSPTAIQALQDIMQHSSRENMGRVIAWSRQLQDNPDTPLPNGVYIGGGESAFREWARKGILTDGVFLPNSQYHWASGREGDPRLDHPLFHARTTPLPQTPAVSSPQVRSVANLVQQPQPQRPPSGQVVGAAPNGFLQPRLRQFVAAAMPNRFSPFQLQLGPHIATDMWQRR